MSWDLIYTTIVSAILNCTTVAMDIPTMSSRYLVHECDSKNNLIQLTEQSRDNGKCDQTEPTCRSNIEYDSHF